MLLYSVFFCAATPCSVESIVEHCQHVSNVEFIATRATWNNAWGVQSWTQHKAKHAWEERHVNIFTSNAIHPLDTSTFPSFPRTSFTTCCMRTCTSSMQSMHGRFRGFGLGLFLWRLHHGSSRSTHRPTSSGCGDRFWSINCHPCWDGFFYIVTYSKSVEKGLATKCHESLALKSCRWNVKPGLLYFSKCVRYSGVSDLESNFTRACSLVALPDSCFSLP